MSAPTLILPFLDFWVSRSCLYLSYLPSMPAAMMQQAFDLIN